MSATASLELAEPGAAGALRPLASYRFDLTCPTCGAQMAHVTSGAASAVETKAVALCEACWAHWCISVQLREVTDDLGRPVDVQGHGTRGHYLGGCRCRPCRDAAKAYQREYRAKRRQRDAGSAKTEPTTTPAGSAAAQPSTPGSEPGRRAVEFIRWALDSFGEPPTGTGFAVIRRTQTALANAHEWIGSQGTVGWYMRQLRSAGVVVDVRPITVDLHALDQITARRPARPTTPGTLAEAKTARPERSEGPRTATTPRRRARTTSSRPVATSSGTSLARSSTPVPSTTPEASRPAGRRRRRAGDLGGVDLDDVVEAMRELEAAGDVEAWKADAACRGQETKGFYLDDGPGTDGRVEGCSSCPARRPCLAYALSKQDVDGVWGGTMGWQRVRILKALKQTSVEAELQIGARP